MTMVCEECLGEGFVMLLEIIPADDRTCPPRWDDWTQPDWDALDDKLPCKVLCTCILAPELVNYIEVAA